MLERRTDERRPARAYGRIWFGRDYAMWADCEVRDLSASGARIELSVSYALPRRLVFTHQLAAAPFEAVLRWQRGAAIGLSLDPVSAGTQGAPWMQKITKDWRELVATLSPSA